MKQFFIITMLFFSIIGKSQSMPNEIQLKTAIDSLNNIISIEKASLATKLDSLILEKNKLDSKEDLQKIFDIAKIKSRIKSQNTSVIKALNLEIYRLKYNFTQEVNLYKALVIKKVKPVTTKEELDANKKQKEKDKKELEFQKKIEKRNLLKQKNAVVLKKKKEKRSIEKSKEKLKKETETKKKKALLLKEKKKRKLTQTKNKIKRFKKKKKLTEKDKSILKSLKSDVQKAKENFKKERAIRKVAREKKLLLKEEAKVLKNLKADSILEIKTTEIVFKKNNVLVKDSALLITKTDKTTALKTDSLLKNSQGLMDAPLTIKVESKDSLSSIDVIEQKLSEKLFSDTILNNDSISKSVQSVDYKQIALDSLYNDLGLEESTIADLKKMELAKQRAIEERVKIDKIETTIQSKQIIFENKVDTSNISSKEKFIQKEKTIIIDKFEADIEVDTSIKIIRKVEEVKIIEKKKKRYVFGDEVDFTHSEKAKFYLHRAKKEIDVGNLSKAKEYINTSLKLNPSFTEAYVMKGDLYASISYFDKAIFQYYKASKLDTGNAQLFYNMGNCFVRLGNDKNAIIEWSKAIAVDSTYILAYAGRASLYLKEKSYQKAIVDYNKMFELNKYFYPAYRGRGLAYLELNMYQQAIADFDAFLEYEPNEPFAITKRGIARLFDNDIFGGCTDMLNAAEMNYEPAKKALKEYCEK